MDMGPYISSIPRLLNLKTILKKKVKIKRNKEKLIISIKFLISFKEGDYNGIFEFGGKYRNQLKVSNNNKKKIIERVFSPPDTESLSIISISKKDKKIIKLKKDNCFKNFFVEVLEAVRTKRYDFYYKRMIHDITFRSNIIKKLYSL